MTETAQPVVTGAGTRNAAVAWLRDWGLRVWGESPGEIVVLLLVTTLLLFYGLVPILGGDQIGLMGADEPRYAQIAREMLEAHNETCNELHASMVPRSLRLTDVRNSLRCLDGGTVTPEFFNSSRVSG